MSAGVERDRAMARGHQQEVKTEVEKIAAWESLNPLIGQILHNKCIPLTVPRFSFSIEDLCDRH